ncbi:MAG: Serine phosphatase RsbU, regulator of sigma subunit, partial [uncultured Phycisphaerae bacterium]
MPDDRPATSSAREPSAARNGELAAIQRLLLPPLPAIAGWDFRSHYRPCEEAGGDLYGSQPLPSGRTGFLVADVSGHGVRAAVVMAMLRAWLGSNKVLDRAGRGETPANINAMLLEVEGLGMFVTAVFVSLDPADGSFYYINCGHPSPRVRRADGRVVRLTDGRTIPLGVADDFGLDGQGVDRLGPGDCLVLFTDGIPEARDAGGDFF